MRMYDLLEMKLIKYRDISEETCMLVDEKVIHFSKAVRIDLNTFRAYSVAV